MNIILNQLTRSIDRLEHFIISNAPTSVIKLEFESIKNKLSKLDELVNEM